jgi:hypothetical protein
LSHNRSNKQPGSMLIERHEFKRKASCPLYPQ